ncbi:MAG: glycosyltransferase family 9 protein [Elusimicrobiales bacterium]|nr:glycosyltransferase family 9 protein [Elusimicrobiales bacterium]
MVDINKPDPKILVIRMSSLGDIILTAPVFRNLKAKWPGARLEILVKPQFLGAVSKSAFIDRAIPFTGLPSALREVNAARYDVIIDLHDTPRSRLISLLAAAPVKLRYRKASLARRLFVGLRIPSPALEKHTLDRYLEPLAALGVPVVHPGPELGDWAPGGARAELKRGPLKICLLQTAFLGDCVLTLPLLKKLREAFPDAAVTVVTRPETAGIFAAAGLAAEIIEDRKKTAASGFAEFSRLTGELRERKFDAAIIPHRSLRSALLAWRAGIPVRVGFSSSAGRALLTHRVPFSWLLHDVERNLALLSPLAENLKSPFPGLRRDAGAPYGPQDGVIAGINAGSAWPTKRWPAENWARLIRRLTAERPGKVLLVGGPGEKDWNAEIERLAGPERCLNLTGKTTMPELMEAIRPLKVFISNDSGPMHIAAALGVPAVGVFGPTTRELGFFPYGPGNRVVETPLACRPCALHGSRKCPRGHFLCMRLLTVDEVFSAAQACRAKTGGTAK